MMVLTEHQVLMLRKRQSAYKARCSEFLEAIVDDAALSNQYELCDIALGSAIRYIDMIEKIIYPSIEEEHGEE